MTPHIHIRAVLFTVVVLIGMIAVGPAAVSAANTNGLTDAGEFSQQSTVSLSDGDSELASADTPNAYQYVNENGVVTLDGLLNSLQDFRSDEIGLDTLLLTLDSFQTESPISGFQFDDQVLGSDESLAISNLTAPGEGTLTTDHLVVFAGNSVEADAIVGSVQLESLDSVDSNQPVVEFNSVNIPVNLTTAASTYTVALHADDGNGNPDPSAVRPWTVQTAEVDIAVDGVILEFREVDGEVTDDPVTAGEELTAYAAIENTGDSSTTETAEFRVDGAGINSKTRTLDPGEREKLLFTYGTEDGDSPSVDASLALGGTETAATTAEVRRPSEFTLNIEDITDPVPVSGGIATVSAEVRVENLGGGTGSFTQTVSLSIGGTEVSTRPVTLQDGETTRITLDGSASVAREMSEVPVTAAVDASGGDTSERVVTLDRPVRNADTGDTFDGIQSAINNSDGEDRIEVYGGGTGPNSVSSTQAGSYDGSVVLNVTGLTLQGVAVNGQPPVIRNTV